MTKRPAQWARSVSYTHLDVYKRQITDRSGRTLSGQTAEAFWYSMRHLRPFSIGLNCALGAKELRPYVDELNHSADTLVSAHPNAGLPNEFGGYDETPGTMGKICLLYTSRCV